MYPVSERESVAVQGIERRADGKLEHAARKTDPERTACVVPFREHPEQMQIGEYRVKTEEIIAARRDLRQNLVRDLAAENVQTV